MALKYPSDKRSITLQVLVTSTLLHQRRMEKSAVLSLEKKPFFICRQQFPATSQQNTANHLS